MSLHVTAFPGDETQPAMMYGPLVLAERLGGKDLTPSMVYLRYSSNPVREPISVPSIQLDSRHPTGWVDPAPHQALTFRTVGQEQTFSLIPLYHLSGGRYVVYWKVKSNAVQGISFFETFYLRIRVSCDFIHRIGSGLLTLPAEGMMRLRTVLLILAGGGAAMVAAFLRYPSLVHAQSALQTPSQPAAISCCGQGVAPRELGFPYYSLRDGYQSTLMLVSDSPKPMDFTLAVRSSLGQMLATSETIQPGAKRSFDLARLITQLGGDPNFRNFHDFIRHANVRYPAVGRTLARHFYNIYNRQYGGQCLLCKRSFSVPIEHF